MTCFGSKHLIKSAPERGDVHYEFGIALLLVDEFDAAIERLTQACQLLPQQHEALFALADAFEAVNSINDVDTVITFALSQFSERPEVLYRAANYYRELGQLAKADELAKQCLIKSKDTLLQSYLWLLRLNIGQIDYLEDAHNALLKILDKAKKFGERQADTDEIEMISNYALGRFFELDHKPEHAFDCWRKANALQFLMCDYKVDSIKALFDEIKSNSSIRNTTTNKANSFTPIFILGLPRTGSTLLEQRLSKHTEVKTLGEQPIIANQVVPFLSHHTNSPYPMFMSELGEQKNQLLCEKAASIYEKALSKRQLNSAFVIDKLPANFQSIGLIMTIFPHAKIIHIKRDFADVGLSIFKNHFAANEPYLCNLDALSTYNAMYDDLMQHWHALYPGKILDIQYEDLVNSQKASMHDALDFCGLEGQQACWGKGTATTESKTMVNTLSSAQVIQAIYKEGAGRHSRYAGYLAKCGLNEHK
jgi:tetratricopeptide (TPR) repeat protein